MRHSNRMPRICGTGYGRIERALPGDTNQRFRWSVIRRPEKETR